MSETYQEKIERLESEPTLPMGEVKSDNVELASAKPESETALNVTEVRRNVAETVTTDQQPDVLKQLMSAENEPQAPVPPGINQELRQVSLRHELKQLQRQLPRPQRLLSRVIHQPVVRVSSEVIGKTASRPSGLLGGGIVAFLGSSSYLFLAKYIGFRYNYSFSLLLFVGGFALGVVLELLVHLLTSRRQNNQSN